MSEQLNGHAQMDANAEATIAASKAARQVTSEALAANAAFDTGESVHAEANALNKQIDQGAVMAEKVDDVESKRMSIEARRTSPDVQAMNQDAEIAIFGSRGQTQGYVDKEGKPLTAPIVGIVDQIRGISQADSIRQNPRYGTKESDRNAAADSYEAQFKAGQGERDARAEGYVKSIEELQAEGFELSQAKLISDLAGEVGARQQALFDKLMTRATAGRNLSPEEEQKARSEAVDRVLTRTLRNGDDVGMLKQIIKQEGLFDRGELDKFRYKRGNEKNGERKEFASYREQSQAGYKNQKDYVNRVNLVNELNAKYLDRQNKAEMKAGAEADAAKRREEDETDELEPISDASPKGLRERIRHMMAKAAVMPMMLGEYFRDDEKGTRRKAVAIVAGALVVGGAAYLEAKGISSGGSRSGDVTMAPSMKPQHHEAVQHAQSVAQNGPGGISAPAPQEHLQQGIDNAIPAPGGNKQAVTELKPGQNPWTVSEHRLETLGNSHPSAAQIEHYDKAMAHLNPEDYSYGGDSSESMPAGTVLKLPK